MKIYLLTLLILIAAGGKLSAQDLVYEPKNPSFGGNTFNYQWMLSSAQAQNKISEKTDDPFSRYERDPLKDFQNSLNQQVLAQLSRQLVVNQFGDSNEGLKEGVYEVGNFRIEVVPTGSGISVTIFDIATGNQTNVNIPFL
jgi:curli production assembly/transport component CsgF